MQRYDWQAIFSGQVVELRQHVDFPGRPEIFRSNLYEKARKLGIKIHTRMPAPGVILVQARRA